jgi:chromosome partitioning protein
MPQPRPRSSPISVIVFASSKGGAGKSTSAVLLASELAESGRRVTVIDADPNRPVSIWAKLPGKPDALTVIEDPTEDTIITSIEDAARRSSFVIVDLEGTASMMVAYAISRADLVIIPSQPSQLDAAQAAKAVRLVRKQEEAFRISIPMAVLFTRTNAAIRTRDLKRIDANFEKNGVAVFGVRIIERAPYRAVFAYGGTLSALDPSQVSGIPAAVENARAFAAETVAMIKTRAAGPAAHKVA